MNRKQAWEAAQIALAYVLIPGAAALLVASFLNDSGWPWWATFIVLVAFYSIAAVMRSGWLAGRNSAEKELAHMTEQADGQETPKTPPGAAEIAAAVRRVLWSWAEPDAPGERFAPRRWVDVEAAGPDTLVVQLQGRDSVIPLLAEPVPYELAAELLQDLSAQAQNAADIITAFGGLREIEIATAYEERLREAGEGSIAAGVRKILGEYLASHPAGPPVPAG